VDLDLFAFAWCAGFALLAAVGFATDAAERHDAALRAWWGRLRERLMAKGGR
jgi:hypothetical protein